MLPAEATNNDLHRFVIDTFKLHASCVESTDSANQHHSSFKVTVHGTQPKILYASNRWLTRVLARKYFEHHDTQKI